jgi:transcriptional regulator with XRE-family HTH domain
VASKLGTVLAEARQKAGLSLRAVERQTGIHNAHLSQIERGVIERPEPSLLFDLASLYGLDYRMLLELSGHVVPRQPGTRDRGIASAAMRAVGELTPHQQAEALQYMARLRQPSEPPALDATLQIRRRIESIAERALHEAGVDNQTRTPLAAVAEIAGAKAVLDLDNKNLPEEIRVNKPPLWKRVLGAVLFRERIVYVDREQHTGRARFTEAHEIAHMLLPWHEETFGLLDDERRLFYGTQEEMEAEANWAAAHLIFQGRRYHERALSNEISIRTPIALANDYDASMHASIRYYVEHHPEAVAVLVAGRYTQFNGALPIWSSLESPSFLEEFGRLSELVPAGGLPVGENAPVLGQLASASMQSVDPPSEKIDLPNLSGDLKRFVAEAFFNQYSVFVMVSRSGVRRAGRRLRLAAADPNH